MGAPKQYATNQQSYYKAPIAAWMFVIFWDTGTFFKIQASQKSTPLSRTFIKAGFTTHSYATMARLKPFKHMVRIPRCLQGQICLYHSWRHIRCFLIAQRWVDKDALQITHHFII
jgi:hypothetical protein